MAERDFAATDYYTDAGLIDDPHPYFEWLRARGPVTRVEPRKVVAVTGYDEAISVLLDTDHFNPINATVGPLAPLPFEVAGDDIAAQVEAHRTEMPFGLEIISQEGKVHRDLRGLLLPVFAPGRIKALRPRVEAIAAGLAEKWLGRGEVEFVSEFAQPFVTLVISELLGIPEEDRDTFRRFMAEAVVADVEASVEDNAADHLAPMGEMLAAYLTERRATPRDDVLSELANAKFADGTEPQLSQLVRLGGFLFGAGQDTTARVMSNGFYLLGDRPNLQHELRENPDRIPAFVEEILRYDGSVKSTARLCIRSTEVAGVQVKAGDTVMIALLAANHDPRRFDAPDSFDMDRPQRADHLGFGRGAHTCVGAALARSEVALALEYLLPRMGEFSLCEKWHGPAGNRHASYMPSFLLRGVRRLTLEYGAD